MKFVDFLRADILKSIWFNFRCLPLGTAWKLPVLLYPRTKVYSSRGRIEITGKVKTGMIKFGREEALPCARETTCLQIEGTVIFEGKAFFGSGSRISVDEGAVLRVGDHMEATGNLAVLCRKEITFGKNCGISWNTQFLDSDRHWIGDANGNKINPDAPIHIGEHVWIGCNCTILKGVSIPNTIIVAAGSTVAKSISTPGCIVGQGSPLRTFREGISWLPSDPPHV
ncbi:MAG: acyltransferase [Lentisphaeria bacterium]|nr:acyltransferase [Lentisphaeria bacterium]